MTRYAMVGVFLLASVFGTGFSAEASKTEAILTSQGYLNITLIGHGTLMFDYGGKIIHVDPYSKVGDYASLPKADLVLITHHHGDHLDTAALEQIMTDKTVVVMTQKCAEQMEGMRWSPVIMANGDKRTVADFPVEAVPAYNIVHKRESGAPFHPRGEGNGYIITFGDKCIYVAGDTENTPEMRALKGIDAAFLPMNLPYTMDSAMAADAAKAFKPKVVYPYHTRSKGGDQEAGFVELMKGVDGVDVRRLQ